MRRTRLLFLSINLTSLLLAGCNSSSKDKGSGQRQAQLPLFAQDEGVGALKKQVDGSGHGF